MKKGREKADIIDSNNLFYLKKEINKPFLVLV